MLMLISNKDPYLKQTVDSKFERVFQSLPKSKLIKEASELLKQKTVLKYEQKKEPFSPTTSRLSVKSKLDSESKGKSRRIHDSTGKQKKESSLATNNDDPKSPYIGKASDTKKEKNGFESVFPREAFTTPIKAPFDITQDRFVVPSANGDFEIPEVQKQSSLLNDINIFDDSNGFNFANGSKEPSTSSSSNKYASKSPESHSSLDDVKKDVLQERSSLKKIKVSRKRPKAELSKLQTFGKLIMKEGKRRESPTL
ncbi:hypothetical protein SPOG_00742 [Schizosaccharomyces cryophilus OY26]|uniref:Uncharacterized protein n=1 Tax=Schizosaccharomyces cryophilus (strain OY26 / ATCC MYA-4695 / CBS 11777 / NBRC 106824 / NRRL Y48691) TaxID=653667 RepID=S9XAB7_SCHCR|nr:uncharacterized protein SPOG_00742 [Schizosaccharomyces cryophilus OY26]EPY50716.1 hypothetical protein SPOG_00742 [Schizosaccharomyces cryophilus OY26]